MPKHPKLEAIEILFNAIRSGDYSAVKSAIQTPLLKGELATVHVGLFEGHSALNTYDAHVTPLKLAMDNFNHIFSFEKKFKENAFKSLYMIVQLILESGVHPDSPAAIWDEQKTQCRYYKALDSVFNERNIDQKQKYALIRLLVQNGASLNQPTYHCENIDAETKQIETLNPQYFWSQLSLQPQPDDMAIFMVENGANPNLAPNFIVNQFTLLFENLKKLYDRLCSTFTPNYQKTTPSLPIPQFLRDNKCKIKSLTPVKVANAIWLSVSYKGYDKNMLIDEFLFWAKNTKSSNITKKELESACDEYDWANASQLRKPITFFKRDQLFINLKPVIRHRDGTFNKFQ